MKFRWVFQFLLFVPFLVLVYNSIYVGVLFLTFSVVIVFILFSFVPIFQELIA